MNTAAKKEEIGQLADNLLRRIYEQTLKGPYHIFNRKQLISEYDEDKKQEVSSEISYLIQKGLLKTSVGSYNHFTISHLGVLTLTTIGIATVISKGITLKILKSLPSDIDTWTSREDLKKCREFANDREIWMSLRILEDFGYIRAEYEVEHPLPFSVLLTANGRDKQDALVLFQNTIPLDEREFQNQISDEIIFLWLNSLHNVENFEVEFKIKRPSIGELRRQIVGLANGKSGIIFLGIKSDGAIVGIEGDPDQEKRHIVKVARKDGIGIKFRTIRNISGKTVLMVMVPSLKELLPIGDQYFIRKDGEIQRIEGNEIIKEYKAKQVANLYGFVFLLSLFNFVRFSHGKAPKN